MVYRKVHAKGAEPENLLVVRTARICDSGSMPFCPPRSHWLCLLITLGAVLACTKPTQVDARLAPDESPVDSESAQQEARSPLVSGASTESFVNLQGDLSDGGISGTLVDGAVSLGSRIVTTRLEPASATLSTSPGETASQTFRLIATLADEDEEIDITGNAVFYVASNHQLGSFPDDGPTFESSNEAARGGYATITALVSDADGSVVETTTGLTVQMHATLDDPRPDVAGDPLPKDPAGILDGADEDESRAPRIVYPNEGALLPPNVNQLDVHFYPGEDNSLFEVTFSSVMAELKYYIRCGELQNKGCVFAIDGQGYQLLANSNRGARPVKITVRGANDAGDWQATSEPVTIQFTDTDVTGGLYYWTTSGSPSIMRIDFGAENAAPEVFLRPNENGMGDTCIGCHAISPDGRKVVASLGGQGDGRQVLVNDLSVPKSDPDFIDRTGQEPSDKENNLQFASFNPDGSRFVAVFGEIAEPERNRLWVHDGETGERLLDETIELPFEPSHPDWARTGDAILMTRVGIHRTSQRPQNSGISMVERDGDGWSDPIDIVPVVDGDGKNRYNPSFVPDTSFFVFSESLCSDKAVEDSGECDGDVDPSAKTWAAVPEANAKPVFLAKASAGGVGDGDRINLSDTFPRSSPFEGYYRGTDQSLDIDTPLRRIFWITIASKRRVGLQNSDRHQQLWMFAVDPEAVLAGKDGSFPAYHLPFQDRSTSNHIAQWTQTIVTDEPPPEKPEPPPPPPPPEPPSLK